MSALPAEAPLQTAAPVAPLSVLEKVGYAAGDAGLNLYWRVFDVFLMVFYTDVFGISPVAAGTMLMVARIWDGINDPIMGLIADRTRTRWGSFRPYLVWMALPMALTAVLAFTTPDWAATPKLWYAYVTYIAMMTAYTAIGIPYSSLMGVLTPSSLERTKVSTYRFVGAFTGGTFVMFAVPLLVANLGGGDPKAGWTYTMAVMGLIATALFIVTFATTRERVTAKVQILADIGRDLGSMVQNRPFWVIGALTAVLFLSISMRGATGIYFLQYVVVPTGFQVPWLGLDMSAPATMLSVFLTTGGFAALAGVFLTTPLVKRFSKHHVYVAVNVLANLIGFAYLLIPYDQVWAFFVIGLLVAFISGPAAPLSFAMLCDVADYGAWKTGRRTTAMVFAGTLFFLKVGAAAGGYLTGVLLEQYGYVANAVQTAEAQWGLLLMAQVYPGVIVLGAMSLMFFYGLSDRTMQTIEQDLRNRGELE